jgi:hypothetical protein
MHDGIAHDVGHVIVAQEVGDLPTTPLGPYKASRPQDPEVLRGQWLGDAERLDELVNASGAVLELDHDRQSVRAGEGAQQFGGSLQTMTCDAVWRRR